MLWLLGTLFTYLPSRQVEKRIIVGLKSHEGPCRWAKDAPELHSRALYQEQALHHPVGEKHLMGEENETQRRAAEEGLFNPRDYRGLYNSKRRHARAQRTYCTRAFVGGGIMKNDLCLRGSYRIGMETTSIATR